MEKLDGMSRGEQLLIFGASARAAAFSAMRAGLKPWCADLFADADLQACCAVQMLGPGIYPQGFADVASAGPPGPWMYTGGLENQPGLVTRISRDRPLWGNDAKALGRARSSRTLPAVSAKAGIPCPAVYHRVADLPPHERWLVKPRRGAGGIGIRFWQGERSLVGKKRIYFHQFV